VVFKTHAVRKQKTAAALH